MTPMAWIKHAAGIALCVAAVWGAWWVWSNDGWLVNQLPQRDPLFNLPLRATISEQRFLAMLVAAMLALTILDWLWRQTFGRIED